MITVRLSYFEIFQAAQAGCMRRIEAMKRNRPDAYGLKNYDPWELDIESSIAEMAVAKAFDQYWQSVATNPATLSGDVGHLQVRSSKRLDGFLIMHPKDPDTAPFYLVTGWGQQNRERNIVGWMYGSQGKRDGYWRANIKRPAFFIPQSDLRPCSEKPEGVW